MKRQAASGSIDAVSDRQFVVRVRQRRPEAAGPACEVGAGESTERRVVDEDVAREVLAVTIDALPDGTDEMLAPRDPRGVGVSGRDERRVRGQIIPAPELPRAAGIDRYRKEQDEPCHAGHGAEGVAGQTTHGVPSRRQ
jgi:hypothetical protein